MEFEQVDLTSLPPSLLFPLVDHLLHLDLSDSRLPAHLLQPLLSSLPSSSLRSGHIQVCFISNENRSLGLAGQDLREVGRDCLALGLVSLERSHSHIISLFLEIPSNSKQSWLEKARLGDEH